MLTERLSFPHGVLLSLDKERKHISFQKHTNSHRFMLVDDIWKVDGVEDVTMQLVNAAEWLWGEASQETL